MKKTEQANKEYKKALWIFIGVTLGCLAVLLLCCYWAPQFVVGIVAVLLAVLMAYFRVKCRRASTRLDLLKAKEKEPAYERSGLFLKIWERYEQYRFAGLFDEQTTVEHLDDACNAIDLSVHKNGREISFNIAEESIYLTAYEGATQLAEKTVPLSELEDMVAFKKLLRAFVEENASS